MAQDATATPLSLLISEARPTVAAGLKYFLGDLPEVQSVTLLAGFDQVVHYAAGHDVALILVGQGLNCAPSLSELRRLRQVGPAWRLALLADVADSETIMTGLSAGACGVIPTSIDEQELRAAITRILSGNVYIPERVASNDQLHPGYSTRTAPSPSPSQPSLTPRQYEVLGVLAQGKTNKQIAQILAISESTVSMHLNAAYLALGVHDRTSAAAAYRNMARPDHEMNQRWSAQRSRNRVERQQLSWV